MAIPYRTIENQKVHLAFTVVPDFQITVNVKVPEAKTPEVFFKYANLFCGKVDNQSDDLLEISNIYENSWKYTYKGIIPQDYLDSIPMGRWVSSIDKFRMNNLVVIENGRIIGTASISKSRWQQYSDYGEIISIYFLPAYMGKGYGQHLLKKCIDELNIRGYDKILLWVLEDNQRARRFYEKNGFITRTVKRTSCSAPLTR